MILATTTAKATDVTVAAYTVPNWLGPTSGVEVRLFLSASLTTPEGQTYPASQIQRGLTAWRFACTVSSATVGGVTVYTVNIPEITIPATTNATVGSQARFHAYFFRSNGVLIGPWEGFQNLRIPNSPASNTWQGIRIYNQTTIPAADVSTYTKVEIDALLVACCAGGSGIPTGSTNQVPGYLSNGNTLTPLSLSTNLGISGSTLGSRKVATALSAVLDYGANGDGVTNTTTALQDCLTASAGSGSVCDLEAGTYLVTGLNWVDGTRLQGRGPGKTIIKSTTGAPIITVPTTSYDGWISGVTVQGNVAAGSNQVGINLAGSSYYYGFSISDVRVEKTGGIGIYVSQPFSSDFRDIFIDDCAGFPLVYDAPVAPANLWTNIYVGVLRASALTAFRIKSGIFNCFGCNGVNNIISGSKWASVGRKNGVDGDSQDSGATFNCTDCNFESFDSHGIHVYSYSTINIKGASSFAGSGNTAKKAIEMDNAGNGASGCTPLPACGFYAQFLKRGIIEDSVDIADGSAGYANGQPFHANGFFHSQIDGLGPVNAGSGMIQTFYDASNSSVSKLARADNNLSTLTVTTGTTLHNPGPGYIEVNSSGGAFTLQLWWAGWNTREQKPLIIKDVGNFLAANPVTITPGGGGTINGAANYVMRIDGESIKLIPDGTGDWRIISQWGGEFRQIYSGGTAPTISFDTGGGTGPSYTIDGSDVAGFISITTGTAPAGSATVFTLNYASTFPAKTPYPVLFPANAAAAALSGTGAVYFDDATADQSGVLLKVGSTALAASTTYQWYYQIIR